MASQLFYKMVTEHTAAQRDQDHIRLILLSDTSIPDRTDAILNRDYEAVTQQLLEDARFLERSGCAAVCIVCNTAHFFADRIRNMLKIPVIHMIRETAALAEEKCRGRRIGIMATDGTVKTELYQRELRYRSLDYFVPPEPVQKDIMYQIYGRIKKGMPYDAEIWKHIENTYREAGCGCVILGCTELSVIKEAAQLSDWYIDPMNVLARKVIAFSGKQYQS